MTEGVAADTAAVNAKCLAAGTGVVRFVGRPLPFRI